jgi:hypothetical protein
MEESGNATSGTRQTAARTVDSRLTDAMNMITKWSDARPVQFTGKNFRSWELRIRSILTVRRATFLFTQRILGDEELNEVALLMLQLSIVESRRHIIRTAKTFKEAFSIFRTAEPTNSRTMMPCMKGSKALSQ